MIGHRTGALCRRAARGIVGLVATAALLVGGGPGAIAADQHPEGETGQQVGIDIRDTVLMFQFPWTATIPQPPFGSFTSNQDERQPYVAELAVGHGRAWAYCLEIDTPASPLDYDQENSVARLAYTAEPWRDDFESAQSFGRETDHRKVLWILAHSAPAMDPTAVLRAADVSVADPTAAAGIVRDATQAAIWHFSQGATLLRQDQLNDDWDSDLALREADPIYVLYQWFLTNAVAIEAPAPHTLTLTSAVSGEAGARIGPIDLGATGGGDVVVDVDDGDGDDGKLPDGVSLHVEQPSTTGENGRLRVANTTAGVSMPATVPASATLWLDVPAGTPPGKVTLSASSVGPIVPVGTIWRTEDQPALVTAKSTTRPLTASSKVSWTEQSSPAPAPVPSLPSPVPSSPSPAPVPSLPSPVPSSPSPAPSPSNAPQPLPAPPPSASQSPSPAPRVTPAPTPKPTSTPAPTPTSTPTPTPTSTPTSSAPRPAPAPKPTPRPTPRSTPLVTRTFQVDRYLPRAAAQARAVARLDDDGRLHYREDRALWGASRHEFVTVRVPASATHRQLLRAINAATSSRVGDVATVDRLATARPGRSYVVAWELARAATTASPWGRSTSLAQRFVARS